MERLLGRFFLVFLAVFVFVRIALAQGVPAATDTPPATGGGTTGTGPNYAVCDACNYCKVTRTDPSDPYTVKTDYVIPDNWESCRKCLYPGTSNANNPGAKETTLINPATGKAPTPKPGSYYTGIGCISTSLGNFREQGSAASVAKALLNVTFGVAGGIAFIYIIFGSFVILTSRADPERLNYGRRILIGAVVGLIFCMGSIFVIDFMANSVLKIPGFGQ